MYIDQTELEVFLRESGLVPRSDIERASERAKEKGESLDEALLSQGLIQDNDLMRIQAHIVGVPYVSLVDYPLSLEVAQLIPEPVVRTHNVLAFNETSEGIEIAVLDLSDLEHVHFVEQKTGKKLLPRLTDTDSIRSALVRYHSLLKREYGDVLHTEAENFINHIASNKGRSKDRAEHISVARMLDVLFRHALSQHAHDVHLEPREKELLVRYRINGILRDAMILPKEVSQGIIPRIKMLAELSLSEDMPQEGRFIIEDKKGYSVSATISVVPTLHGEKAVLRLLGDNTEGFTLEGLGFEGENLERLHGALHSRDGLVLLCGPSSSGKTTTLYTMLDSLSGERMSISSIENPIEHKMKGINQTEVREDIGLSYARGLRALLRQDPDVLMVSELWDRETARVAGHAALSGKLVFSSFPLASVRDIGHYLEELEGRDSGLLSSSLRACVGLRLARRLSPHTETHTLETEDLKMLGGYIDMERVMGILVKEGIVSKNTAWKDIKFKRPKNKNREEGYEDMVGIQEVMLLTPSILKHIEEGSAREKIQKQAEKEGMVTVPEDVLIKAVRGITSIEEVERLARSYEF